MLFFRNEVAKRKRDAIASDGNGIYILSLTSNDIPIASRDTNNSSPLHVYSLTHYFLKE